MTRSTSVYPPPLGSTNKIDFRYHSNKLIFGTLKHTWQPVMTADTTNPSYWLNWRFFLCAVFVVTSLVLASILIWKFEGFNRSRSRKRDNERQSAGFLFEDQAWKTCVNVVHPIWLLTYRIIAFVVLLALILVNVVVDGGGIFYFYTQWTFTLVTVYFALGSSLSLYGCCKYQARIGDNATMPREIDSERGTYIPPILGESEEATDVFKSSVAHNEGDTRQKAGIWIYIFQIIFQMCSGAVVLTDCVFWLILYPFLTAKDYGLNFMIVSMHSINAVFLLGDTCLNCLRFPFFRIAYFVLWTGLFVIFQWIIHACISMWWPYPFLDLSRPYAPLWYLGIGLTHIPSYGIFALIVKVKQLLLSRTFPDSYQCGR